MIPKWVTVRLRAAVVDRVRSTAAKATYFMKAENLAAVGQGDWLIPTTHGARDAILKATGGKNGWQQTLASGNDLTKAPFQSVENYPQPKDLGGRHAAASKTDLERPGRVMASVALDIRAADAERWAQRVAAMDVLV